MNDNLINVLLEKKSILKEVIIYFSGVCVLAVLAQISIPLPGTPVPITAQTLGVLIIGSSFGKKRAFFTMLLYVLIGAFGFPVFSEGKFGLSILTGATGGYLIGFILAGTTMGYFGDKTHDRKILKSLLIFLLGHLLIFICGLAWLTKFVGAENVLAMGLYPFIPGLLIKTILAGIITPTVWSSIK